MARLESVSHSTKMKKKSELSSIDPMQVFHEVTQHVVDQQLEKAHAVLADIDAKVFSDMKNENEAIKCRAVDDVTSCETIATKIYRYADPTEPCTVLQNSTSFVVLDSNKSSSEDISGDCGAAVVEREVTRTSPASALTTSTNKEEKEIIQVGDHVVMETS